MISVHAKLLVFRSLSPVLRRGKLLLGQFNPVRSAEQCGDIKGQKLHNRGVMLRRHSYYVAGLHAIALSDLPDPSLAKLPWQA